MRKIVFLGLVLAGAAPALAQQAAPSSAQAPAAQPQPAPARPQATTPSRPFAQRIDQRIAQMRSQLHITPEQQPAWDNVAQIMRQNAADMEQAFADRAARMDKMNAVENLRDFASLEEQRAQGLQKLVAAFEPLYASFSDSQKKTADAIFQRQGERAHARRQQQR